MTEAYEKELFGLRCGDLIETIGAVLKFELAPWQRHRLEVLRAELVGARDVLTEGGGDDAAANNGMEV